MFEPDADEDENEWDDEHDDDDDDYDDYAAAVNGQDGGGDDDDDDDGLASDEDMEGATMAGTECCALGARDRVATTHATDACDSDGAP